MSALIVVLASGLLYCLSTNLGTVWALAWIAPVPVLWYALGPAGPLRVFAVAFAAFFAGEAGLVHVYAGVVPLPALILALAIPAAAFGGAVLLTRWMTPSLPPWLGVLAFPCVWTAWEYLFSLASPNGTMLSIAYSQAAFLALIQIVRIAGLPAVTFLLCLVPSGIALLLRARPLHIAYLAVPVFAVSLSMGFGIVSLLRTVPQHSVRVGLVAKDDNRAGFGTRERFPAGQAAGSYAEAVEALAAKGAALVVLPESCITLRPEWADDVRTFLSETARMSRVQIVVGYDEYLRDGAHRNIAEVISSNGVVAGRYVKHKHLPGQDYEVGSEILTFPGGLGVSICKDLDFPSLGRRYSQAGTGVMLVPAWDFQKDALMHARMAWMRGVEGGFAVVRSAEEGLLSVTDDKGSIVRTAASKKGSVVVLEASVRPGPGGTLYSRIGDLFAGACTLIAAVLAGIGERRRKSALRSAVSSAGCIL
jgi:apolipoprotein N-acyltransferase